jgi:hypothetical protein
MMVGAWLISPAPTISPIRPPHQNRSKWAGAYL